MRYKFRYLNGIYKTGAMIAGPLQNFFITTAAFLLVYYLIAKLTGLFGFDDSFLNGAFYSVFREIMFCCAFILALLCFVLKKGVFLYDDKLVIARYTITPTNWNPYISIRYSEIEQANVNYSDLHYTKHRFSFVTLCGDESYNVELTLKNGKKYFFSIQNQEEFVSELLSRMGKDTDD